MHCLTLYFLGAGAPLYLEAPDFDLACAQLFAATGALEQETQSQIRAWADHINAGRGRYSRLACEHGALGLAWHYEPDPAARADRAAFGRRMRAGPYGLQPFAGLSYADCVTAREESIDAR